MNFSLSLFSLSLLFSLSFFTRQTLSSDQSPPVDHDDEMSLDSEDETFSTKELKVRPDKAKDILEPKTAAVILTDKSFSKLVKGTWFIDFHSPFCKHCKTLSPIWEALAIQQKKLNQFNVGTVDCQKERATCQRFDAVSFPTLILFQDKDMYYFTGERTVEQFTEFALEGYKTVQGQKIPKAAPLDGWLLKSKIVPFNPRNFYSKLRGHNWFIYLYAMVELETLVPYASEVSWKVPPNWRVGSINTDKDKDFFEPIFGTINEWPTVFILHDDQLYHAQREVDGKNLIASVPDILEYIDKQKFRSSPIVPFEREPPNLSSFFEWTDPSSHSSPSPSKKPSSRKRKASYEFDV